MSPKTVADLKTAGGKPIIAANQGIHISRIEGKKAYAKTKTSFNDEQYPRLERYSSQAQEELLKSYQQSEIIEGGYEGTGKGFFKKRYYTSHGPRKNMTMKVNNAIKNIQSQSNSNIFGQGGSMYNMAKL